MSITVQCPSCGRQHQANESLFGRAARCTCGATLQIPDPRQAAETADPFWDSLDAKAPAPPADDDPLPSSGTPEEEGQQRYAKLYTAAITQIQSGASPKRVLDSLIAQGVPADVARDMVRQIAPKGYVQRADNRAAGRAQMIQGLIGQVAGILLAAVAFRVGVIVLASVILMLVGLFRFLVGLLSFLTGAR